MNVLQEEWCKDYKRTLYLWRKAKNGQPRHLKQVAKVLRGLDISKYGSFANFRVRYDSIFRPLESYEAALLYAIAEKILSPQWEWELYEAMNGKVDIIVKGFSDDLPNNSERQHSAA